MCLNLCRFLLILGLAIASIPSHAQYVHSIKNRSIELLEKEINAEPYRTFKTNFLSKEIDLTNYQVGLSKIERASRKDYKYPSHSEIPLVSPYQKEIIRGKFGGGQSVSYEYASQSGFHSLRKSNKKSDQPFESLEKHSYAARTSIFLENLKINKSSFLNETNLPLYGHSFQSSTEFYGAYDYNSLHTNNYFSDAGTAIYEIYPDLDEQKKVFEKSTDQVNFFHERSLFSQYPDFSFLPLNPPKFLFDIFSLNALIPLPQNENIVTSEDKTYYTTNYPRDKRQRRANWIAGNTYSWEINDFNSSNSSDNPKLTEPSNFVSAPNTTTQFNLNVIANDGIDSLSVLAYGTTGGNAQNDYIGSQGFLFLSASGWTGNDGDVTSFFNLNSSSSGGNTGIDEWLNGFDGYTKATDLWGVYKAGDNFYLTYEFSNLNFSPVPEPSTYFMTGALFCLLGCNSSSRRSLKFLLCGTLLKYSAKENCEVINNRTK